MYKSHLMEKNPQTRRGWRSQGHTRQDSHIRAKRRPSTLNNQHIEMREFLSLRNLERELMGED